MPKSSKPNPTAALELFLQDTYNFELNAVTSSPKASTLVDTLYNAQYSAMQKKGLLADPSSKGTKALLMSIRDKCAQQADEQLVEEARQKFGDKVVELVNLQVATLNDVVNALPEELQEAVIASAKKANLKGISGVTTKKAARAVDPCRSTSSPSSSSSSSSSSGSYSSPCGGGGFTSRPC